MQLDSEVGMSASAGPPGPWIVSIGAELERVAKVRRDAGHRYNCPSMFRVPSYIKTLKSQSYEHQVLSFGLYDRDFIHMTRMDKVRLEVVSEFLEQWKTMGDSSVQSWDALCACVAGSLGSRQELQHLYDDGPGGSLITSTTVRSVLTFDAVFLTVFSVLFYSENFEGMQLQDVGRLEGIFRQKGVSRDLSAIYFDLWLLENQIPLCLIREVWNMVYENKSDQSFNTLIRRTISFAMETYLRPRAESKSDNHGISFLHCNHLLHCLYTAFCHQNTTPSAIQAPEPGRQIPTSGTRAAVDPQRSTLSSARATFPQTTLLTLLHWTSKWVGVLMVHFWRETRTCTKDTRSQRSLLPITELHKVGIVVRGVQTSVTDIRFKSTFFKATLYLPQIDIEDNTEKILRNLSAFEMIHSDNEHKLISYLSIMDDLINTEEDVRLLRKGKDPVIGVNYLGDDKDIAALFNALGQNVCFKESEECRRLRKEVNDWCIQGKRQKLIRFLDRFHDRPWILGSLIAATLLLLMTGLQTTYTIIGFYHTS